MKMKRRLCLFTRYPRLGETKTRLIPALGAQAAADLQRALTDHIAAQIRLFQEANPVQCQVWHTDCDDQRMRSWLGADFDYRRQGHGDIGRKMLAAFKAAAADGCDRTLVIGADVPGITPALLSVAYELLADHDVVLGPSLDGGYYLIGLRAVSLPPCSEKLFDGIAWGSEAVFEQTVSAAEALGLSVGQLKWLRDIDQPADLVEWDRVQKARGRR